MIIYKSESATKKNVKDINKPNEDYCLCDDASCTYILADGVSRDKINGIYPNPSPSEDVATLFVKSVHESISNNSGKEALNILESAIETGNDRIRAYNNKKQWDNEFYPGTVGIIVTIRNQELFYAYIGDCYGLVLNRDKKFFSKCQTDKIAEHRSEFSTY